MHTATPHPDLYPATETWDTAGHERFLPFLKRLENSVRARDSRIEKVIARISDCQSHIMMFNSNGELVCDSRPMCSITVSAIFVMGDRRESKTASWSYRCGAEMIGDTLAEQLAEETVSGIDARFEAKRPKGGEMPVVMGAGASGRQPGMRASSESESSKGSPDSAARSRSAASAALTAAGSMREPCSAGGNVRRTVSCARPRVRASCTSERQPSSSAERPAGRERLQSNCRRLTVAISASARMPFCSDVARPKPVMDRVDMGAGEKDSVVEDAADAGRGGRQTVPGQRKAPPGTAGACREAAQLRIAATSA